MGDVLLNPTPPTIAAAFATGARRRGFSSSGLPLAAMPVSAGRGGKAWCLALFAFLGNCAYGATPEHTAAADTIFIHGDVVTMDAQGAVAGAVAVKDGRITHVGNPEDLLAYRSAGTEPNGIVEEQAWVPIWTEILNPPLETRLRLTAKALQLYVAEGFTTIQDGGTVDLLIGAQL